MNRNKSFGTDNAILIRPQLRDGFVEDGEPLFRVIDLSQHSSSHLSKVTAQHLGHTLIAQLGFLGIKLLQLLCNTLSDDRVVTPLR